MLNEELLKELAKPESEIEHMHSKIWNLNHNPYHTMDFIPELEMIASKIDRWAGRFNPDIKYYLWDTKTLAAKILKDAKEECGYGDTFARMAYFCTLYLKCFAPFDVAQFIKDYYDTGYKNYNIVIREETMFTRMYNSELPYIASLIWIIHKNNNIMPINSDMYKDIVRVRCKLECKKPTKDGLMLEECNEKEAANAANAYVIFADEYNNIDMEEFNKKIAEKTKKIEEIDLKIEELLNERERIRNQ